MEKFFLLAIIAICVIFLYYRYIGSRIIFEYERGLLYVNGRFKKELGPGKFRYLSKRSFITKVDVRSRFRVIKGQEVLTSDGITVKLAVAAEFEIKDPGVAINEVACYEDALYTTVQLSLRRLVSERTAEELLTAKGELGKKLTENSGPEI
ncbi:MAG: SPFH domain-containing protein, partial [Thermodesulfobacteriota bacterium]